MTEEELKALEEAKNKQKEQEEEPGGDENDPAKIIADLKANTVDKKKYEELKSKYNSTLKALAEGKTIEEEKKTLTSKERAERIKELRANLFTDQVQDLTNLEYWKQTLELRQHILDETKGKKDIFYGKSKDPINDGFDQTSAINMVVDVVQQCIDGCNDDSAVFSALLQSRLEDDPALAMKLAQRKAKEKKASLGR